MWDYTDENLQPPEEVEEIPEKEYDPNNEIE
jgi:hypothetical protein